MTSTSFTELVGCDVPIQSAPMGGISGPDLVGAVTGAGAMAMVSFPMQPAAAVAAQLDHLLGVAAGPIGVNVLMPFLDRDAVVEAARRAALVDLYHGAVDASVVELIHDSGALAGWQVGTPDEALAAAAAGCDVVIVRGTEGGGRMYGERPLRPLLDEVVAAVGVPVVAAGGVGTAAQVAELLDAGAAGVRVGTRLLATRESGAHPFYKRAVIAARADDTALTDEFHVLWPDERRSARVIRTCIEAAAALDDDEPVAEVVLGGEHRALPRFAIPPPTADVEGRVEAMPLYAGTAVQYVEGEEPAADVIRALSRV